MSELEETTFQEFKKRLKNKGLGLGQRLESRGYSTNTDLFEVGSSVDKREIIFEMFFDIYDVLDPFLDTAFLLKRRLNQSVAEVLNEESLLHYSKDKLKNFFGQKSAFGTNNDRVLSYIGFSKDTKGIIFSPKDFLESENIKSAKLTHFKNGYDSRFNQTYRPTEEVLFRPSSKNMVYDFVNSILLPRKNSDELVEEKKEPLALCNEVPERFLEAATYFRQRPNQPKVNSIPLYSSGELVNFMNQHLGKNLTGFMLCTDAYKMLVSKDGHIYRNQIVSAGQFLKEEGKVIKKKFFSGDVFKEKLGYKR